MLSEEVLGPSRPIHSSYDHSSEIVIVPHFHVTNWHKLSRQKKTRAKARYD
jgi:hypothetical protein